MLMADGGGWILDGDGGRDAIMDDGSVGCSWLLVGGGFWMAMVNGIACRLGSH